ncbi:MAG: hypothetical protein JST28_24400 [Acidobacteria bacterium]|nr:hypothetical protein [Acidobacteriota bacterium]
MADTTVLYRPTSERELELIRDADWRAFPPRLPEQPIFYPVLEESYAVQIAQDWNTRDGGTGYVLRFEVETDYISRYPVQVAGALVHREYWIPAEDLEEFNSHIVGQIEVLSTFHSSKA